MIRRRRMSCLQNLRTKRTFFTALLVIGTMCFMGGCSVRERIKEKIAAEIRKSETQEDKNESTGGGKNDGNSADSSLEFLEKPQVSKEEHSEQQEETLLGKEEEIPEEEDSKEEIVLPRRFDYREIGKQPEAGDQGKFGTCWAFASLMAMESSLLPDEEWRFSADHMSRKNSFSMSQEDGGQYAMSMAYLLAWQGPVLEADDPYGDGYSPDGLIPVKHVQEIRLLESKNYQKIKEAIYRTGGVQSSLFTYLKDYTSRDRYYNEETYGYYYSGEEKANHNVVIIGWDDDYPKENFKQQPEEDGAFICLNSWGPRFGEAGCFYVSYEDSNIGDINVLYSKITDPQPNERIYQSDLCGWIGQIGYGEEEAYFAAVYQAKEREELTAAGFYATLPDTRYTVYGAKVSSPEKMKLSHPLAEGKFNEAGFYTVEFSEPIELMPGEKFTIVVDIYTPEAVHPVAIEYQAPDLAGEVDVSDGEGYLSSDGKTWVNAEENQKCNLCLKAYTRVIGQDTR